MSERLIYCVVPQELAATLLDPLRHHFGDDPRVQVIVELRGSERRGPERRAPSWMEELGEPTEHLGAEPSTSGERRRIRNPGGRRVAERRAALMPIAPPRELPRRLRRYADQIVFVERVAPASVQEEDFEDARLLTRVQAGQDGAFTELYMRYFHRVYGYLRILVRDSYEAEDLTQQVFLDVWKALPRYERGKQPFRTYLFAAVRNRAISHLRKSHRLELAEPEIVEARIEAAAEPVLEPRELDWIGDRDLVLFIERLPLAHRQVLLLRYMLDLSHAHAAEVLGTSEEYVRALHSRGLRFLEHRLRAVRRHQGRADRSYMGRRARTTTVLAARRLALG